MAITGHGYDGTMGELRWAQLHDMFSDEVVTGLAPTVRPASTRQIDLGIGNAYGGGVMGVSDAAAISTHASQSTNPRYDLIVMRHTWSTNTSAFAIVVGSTAANPIVPDLTRTPGVTWDVPIARVLVRAGVGQFLASDLTDIRPTRRRLKRYADTATYTGQNGANTTPKTIGDITIPDPGWSHILRITAQQEFDDVSQGFGRIYATVDGSVVRDAKAGTQNESPAILYHVTTPRSGAAHVLLQMVPVAMVNPDNLTPNPQYAHFMVEVDPV